MEGTEKQTRSTESGEDCQAPRYVQGAQIDTRAAMRAAAHSSSATRTARPGPIRNDIQGPRLRLRSSLDIAYSDLRAPLESNQKQPGTLPWLAGNKEEADPHTRSLSGNLYPGRLIICVLDNLCGTLSQHVPRLGIGELAAAGFCQLRAVAGHPAGQLRGSVHTRTREGGIETHWCTRVNRRYRRRCCATLIQYCRSASGSHPVVPHHVRTQDASRGAAALHGCANKSCPCMFAYWCEL
jgi:hypothetical protein